MLDNYPKLLTVVDALDAYLSSRYPEYFGSAPSHPFAKLKPYKVIHDNLWGTNRFSWRELLLIDSPLLQRLRDIHQTGLAYQVYPCARHSRFEHCLGVTTVSSRVFDSLVERQPTLFDNLANVIDANKPKSAVIQRLRSELRLAALLHDTGHSIHSHTSEVVYSQIPLLQTAAKQISNLAGRKKGEGEVLSFCLSQTKAIKGLLTRGQEKLMGPDEDTIDLNNVSLLIIGRSRHPYTQFLGDIISSDFDSDKLDYLLRDAVAAGLPLRYDLERYLSTVRIATGYIADDERHLEQLYKAVGTSAERKPSDTNSSYEHYDSYVLRLPKQAMSTIEQIVICKFMLYSYIYHHRKVRAAEGLLSKLLRRAVAKWQKEGMDDKALISKFMDLVDPSLHDPEFTSNPDGLISQYCRRVIARQLPREVLGFVPNMTSHIPGDALKDFTSRLVDSKRRDSAVAEFEEVFGEELLKQNGTLGQTWKDALWKTGAWLDVPSPPKFENVDLVVGADSGADKAVQLASIFPIRYWIQAYQAHRYHVRVFAFSEFADIASAAAKIAMRKVLKIDDVEFIDSLAKSRKP